MLKTDILSEIIANKRFEVDLQKTSISIFQLEDGVEKLPPTRSMKSALLQSGSGIIAEFKRRSPSKGWINEEARIESIIPQYEAGGAAALSILTDEKYFGGSMRDIRTARPLTNLPILRKDFIIDDYQLYQARLIGADAVLLIAAALSLKECKRLVDKAHFLGLEVLLEIHSEEELIYIDDSIDMIGVNNRNLGSFHTDINNSIQLSDHLPKDKVLVSESGLDNCEILNKLRNVGYRGFLMGEVFMKTDNQQQTLERFTGDCVAS